ISLVKLTVTAKHALSQAYAPYSHYPVAAAAMDRTGQIHLGVNIENASYGVTLCAECSLISSWRLNDDAALTHLVCLDAAGQYITPCGRCLELLHEHAPSTLSIATQQGPVTLAQLLPNAFGPENVQE